MRRRLGHAHNVLNQTLKPFFHISSLSLSKVLRKRERRKTLLSLSSLKSSLCVLNPWVSLVFKEKKKIKDMAAVNQDNTLVVATTTAPSNSKQSQPRAKTVDSQSVLKRLQSELMALMMSGDSGISAFPEEDNIFCWKGTIIGSKDTVFEGTEYRLSLTFPNDYPFKPPKVKFETLCFHPNVDLVGNICLDILQDKWSSAYDVRTILLSIQSLLGEPNISSPLNNQAAQLWSNQDDYRKMVEKLYKSPKA